MKIPYCLITSVRSSFASACAAIALLASSVHAAPGAKVHTFTAGPTNTNGSILTMDHPDFNAKPGLKLIVTQLWTATYNAHPVGLQYDTSAAKWQIVNEDGASIDDGCKFNVMNPVTKTRVNAGTQNSYFDRTFFSTQKKHDTANLLETHVINPVTSLIGVRQTSNTGLFFIPISNTVPAPVDSGKWSVYNEDFSTARAAAYNVADVTKDKIGNTPISFRHVANNSNNISFVTVITNPLTDNNPNAVLFVNHVYTTANSTLLDHPLAVDFISGHWRIFNEDQATMPAGVEFVVEVFPSVTP